MTSFAYGLAISTAYIILSLSFCFGTWLVTDVAFLGTYLMVRRRRLLLQNPNHVRRDTEFDKSWRWLLPTACSIGLVFFSIFHFMYLAPPLQKVVLLKEAVDYYKNKNIPAAIAGFDYYFLKYPNDSSTLNIVAWKFATKTSPTALELDRAKSYAEKATTLSSHTEEYWDTLACALAVAGETKRAIEIAETHGFLDRAQSFANVQGCKPDSLPDKIVRVNRLKDSLVGEVKSMSSKSTQ